MHKTLEYGIFFVVLVLLQAFLFNNLDLGVYINPLVYVGFILLLPMEVSSIAVLMLGLLLGVTTDFMVGTAGLNTIATLFTAFTRRQTMTLMIGKETVGEGGAPLSARIGTGKFLRYISVAVLLHCIVFFTFEAMSFRYFHLTLLKILLSSAVTVTLVYVSQFLLIGAYGKKTAAKL